MKDLLYSEITDMIDNKLIEYVYGGKRIFGSYSEEYTIYKFINTNIHIEVTPETLEQVLEFEERYACILFYIPLDNSIVNDGYIYHRKIKQISEVEAGEILSDLNINIYFNLDVFKK